MSSLSSFPRCWQWQHDRFEQTASVSLMDRGFRYGMSLFESLRLSEGNLHFAKSHWINLNAAASRCAFPIPQNAFPALQSLCTELPGDWFVRWYLTAGEGAPLSPPLHPSLFVIAEPRPRPPLPPCYVRLHPQPVLPLLGGLKTANYWSNLDALQQAHSLGFDEALLATPPLHSSPTLISATTANLFLQIAGQWHTPALSSGARKGVVRRWILDHFDCKESVLSLDALRETKSAFLSNSWIGIRPIAHLDHRPLQTSAEIASLQALFENAPQASQ